MRRNAMKTRGANVRLLEFTREERERTRSEGYRFEKYRIA
jgi:hypothetical protein